MNGILIIDKPAGITSHDVVARVRRVLGTKRVGHTGTLDPFATGVMVVMVGQATRLVQFLDRDEKEYVATVRFGFETDTGDLTGVQSAECEMQNAEVTGILASTDWKELLGEFSGEIEQIPPMYSAKKVAGMRLYEMARKGETIERSPIKITISELEVASEIEEDRLDLRVVCSAGTYIRTLAEDIGRRIGVRAHLTALRRTRAGRFALADAITLDDLAGLDDPAARLLPMELAVAHLAEFAIIAERVDKTLNGMSTRVFDQTFSVGESIRMTAPDGQLLAIGQYDETENSVRPKVVLV